jgi:predicted secreted protein
LSAAETTITVTEKQQGGVVRLAVNGTLQVQLSASLGTGYGWQPVRWNEEILRLHPDVRRGDVPALGAPSLQTFTFTALQAGESHLRFEYRRPWEGVAAAARTFEIEVKVES